MIHHEDTKNTKTHKALNIIIPVLLIIISLSAFAFLGLKQIASNSVTADEFVHIPVGLTYIEKKDYSFDRRGNPPLLRKKLARPVWNEWYYPIFSPPKTPLLRYGDKWKKGDFYGVGWEFMVDAAGGYHNYFLIARKRILIYATGVVFLIFISAIAIYGWRAAIIAAALASFSASLIAHGSLATLDTGLAWYTFLSLGMFIFLCRKPHILTALGCGLFTAEAMLAKYTGATVVIFQLACLCIVFAARRMGRDKVFSELASLRKILPQYLLALVVATIFINAGYLFHGTFTPLGDMPLRGKLFGALAEAAGWLRLPLPSDYVIGLDAQSFATGKVHTYYLMGKLSTEGWWHYFIVTYLVKESIPAILLFAAALLSIFKMRLRAEEIFFLVPAAGIFLFYSFIAKVDLGIRYLLPALPFIYVFSARLAAVDFGRAKKAAWAVIAALLVWHAVGTVRVSPYLLAYFNEAAGGPEGGRRYVIESNYDWGQNLIALKKYMDERGIERIMLRNYGLVSPQIYGISASWVPCKPTMGLIAISPNYVYGVDPFMRMAECYKWLRAYEPVDIVGYSLFVYKIEGI